MVGTATAGAAGAAAINATYGAATGHVLVKLLRHIGIRVMLIEELNGMKTATVDVEVDVAAVEIRGAGFPRLYFWMHGFYGFPDGLAETLALNTHLYIKESQFTHIAVSGNDGTAYSLAILVDGFVCFGTFCIQRLIRSKSVV